MQEFDLAIAGAGIVGTSTALWAAMQGQRVSLIDAGAPGAGTSSGNACTIATYACLPVNDPSVFAALPGLLTSRTSPLALSWRHALANPRWMLSFLANCRPARSRAIAGHLAALLAHADAGLNPLIEEASAQDLVIARGQLSLWSTEAGAKGAEPGLALRRALGVSWRELSPDEAREMEPALRLPLSRAVHFPEARHIRDPEALVRRFHTRFTELGGTTLACHVSKISPDETGVTVTLDNGETLRAAHAVIAAGAFSGSIAGSGAENLPLGTERGYHLMFPGEEHRLSRPTGWAEGGFYAVPMARGLRLAGTVEIAALDAPENPSRIAYLKSRAQELFDDLPEPASHWLGFRPTLPDSLPAIGPAPGAPRILHAFGHQHLGLTLGGLTGRIVADMVRGRAPNLDLSAFAPGRRFT